MSLNIISDNFTDSTLDTIIQNSCGSELAKHTHWEFGTGFKKGDSYLSDIFRLIIKGDDGNGQETSVSVVVKAIPKNKSRRETFRSTDFFRNEISIYTKVFSYFKEFQDKKGISDAFIEFPKLLAFHTDGINDFIALEDLAVDGYKTASRKNGMSLLECELALKTMGRFHAVSHAIKDQKPDDFDKLTQHIEETYYSENQREWYAPFAVDLIRVVRDAVAREYGGTEYENKLKAFTDANFYTRMCNLVNPNGKNVVISHGDCWAPNFLMRSSGVGDDTVPLAARLIDFQLARVSSPILDVSFFIYSCTTQELRDEFYDHLLKVYYDSCSELIKELGSDPNVVFPVNAFNNEVKEYARFGCGMAFESLPFSVMNDEDTPDLSAMEGDTPLPLNQILTPKIIDDAVGRRRLADVFKHGVDSGYLNDF